MKTLIQIILLIVIAILSMNAFANAEDVFNVLNDKGDDMLNGFTKFTLIAGAIALSVIGLIWYRGKIPANYFYGVLGGTITISMASEIIVWLATK